MTILVYQVLIGTYILVNGSVHRCKSMKNEIDCI